MARLLAKNGDLGGCVAERLAVWVGEPAGKILAEYLLLLIATIFFAWFSGLVRPQNFMARLLRLAVFPVAIMLLAYFWKLFSKPPSKQA